MLGADSSGLPGGGQLTDPHMEESVMTTSREISPVPNDRMTVFGYEQDSRRDFPKKSMRLSRTETLTVSAQIINAGGETNMHSHTNADEAWVVFAGRARFYGVSRDPGEKEEIIGELGPRQGIIIPKGVPYWFESASNEQLEILRVSSVDHSVKAERVNYEPLREWQETSGLGGRDASTSERIATQP